nr:aromatic peroxygenase [Quercus suber]
MRFSFTATAVLVANAVAFPAMDQLTAPVLQNARLNSRAANVAPQGAGALPLTPPPFDAKAQYVSNKGKYAFKAPGRNDARGMCPGLNALANHGYLPHNGVASIKQFVDATNAGFGMAKDLGGFLALFGAIVDGSLTSWSIQGVPHTGIGGSHGNYETDSSPFKADLNQYGSNSKLIMSQFKTLYNMQPDAATANYNMEIMRAFRGKRFQESIDKNPYFSYQPFGGIEVSQAAFTFIYRFMANKSAENPEGILNKAVLKSFHSISGPENNLVWTPGHERIPDNWYKRHPSDEYSIPYFEADILYFAETQPEILTIGCNQGRVDSYNAIDAATISSGAYTASQLAQNPVCFASEFAITTLPALTGLSTAVLKPLTSKLQGYLSGLDCTRIGAVNMTALTACPGFSFYGGPTGPVASGAVQS